MILSTAFSASTASHLTRSFSESWNNSVPSAYDLNQIPSDTRTLCGTV
jgi:hypothetical protein